MMKQRLIINILLVVTFLFTGCLENFKEDKKVEKELLSGTSDEHYYQNSKKYFEEGNYSESLKYNLKQLEEDFKYYKEQSAEVAVDYNNIGLNYNQLGEHKKALEYYLKAMEIEKIVLDTNSSKKATTFYNMASAYFSVNDFNRSLHYYNKSLLLDKEPINLIATYDDMASIYEAQHNYKASLTYYKKSLILQNGIYSENEEIVLRTKSKINQLTKQIN